MKTILATGDLGTLKQVYQASLVAMMAGSDFIKTSTGKEEVNATLEFSLVMTRAIREYRERTGYKVGFKPAGGISKAKQALAWQALMKEELGDEWLMPDLFRIGRQQPADRPGAPAVPLHSPVTTPRGTTCRWDRRYGRCGARDMSANLRLFKTMEYGPAPELPRGQCLAGRARAQIWPVHQQPMGDSRKVPSTTPATTRPPVR